MTAVAPEVFGIPMYCGDVSSATNAVLRRAQHEHGGYACFANVHVVMTAHRSGELRDALDGAWKVFPDGAPVAWMLRRADSPAARRVAGPDLMWSVLREGRTAGIRHFLFGGTDAVVAELRRAINLRLPGAEVVGAYAPSLRRENSEDALERIAASAADVVWVALGAPNQELWMARHSKALSPSLVLGVGAAFDFHSGAKVRAPLTMQRLGLEWAHRMVSEPRRLGPRYLKTNVPFLFAATAELARMRRDGRRAGPHAH